MGAKPSNCAMGKEAEFQESSEAGISAHARCECVAGSASLEFCMALVDRSWTCEGGALPFAQRLRLCGSRLLLLWWRHRCAFRYGFACLPHLHRRPAWGMRLIEALHLLGFVRPRLGPRVLGLARHLHRSPLLHSPDWDKTADEV